MMFYSTNKNYLFLFNLLSVVYLLYKGALRFREAAGSGRHLSGLSPGREEGL